MVTTRSSFSSEFKDAVVKRLLSRGSQSLGEFCSSNNLSVGNVTRWRAERANGSGMKSKSKYSGEQILKIISETHALNENELGLYLRKNGLHSAQLTEWRNDFLSSVGKQKSKENKKEERELQLKITTLEKNLKRKDAALAEASALLILQKKIQLIWPAVKEDEDA